MAADDTRSEWIRIPDDTWERLEQLARDQAAEADRRGVRYARPDERKEVGLRIDPTTAEVFFDYAQTLDPYGDDPDLPEEDRQVGREYFAYDPNVRVVVWFDDLPVETVEALDEKWRRAAAEGWRRIREIVRGREYEHARGTRPRSPRRAAVGRR